MKADFKRIRKLQIMGQEFKVQWSDLSKEGLYGDCNVDEKIIRICTKANSTEAIARQTLCHEAMHAVLELTGIKHHEGFEQMEEMIVRAIDYNFLPAIDEVTRRMEK